MKFNYFQDKVTVKQKAYSVLDKDAPYRVSDQYPKPIQDRLGTLSISPGEKNVP